MKKLLLISLSIALSAQFLFAQKQRPQANPELKQEMRAYVEEEIVPVLQEKQSTFDEQLSEEDLAFILAKRQEVKALREKAKTQRSAMRKKRGSEKNKEEMRGKFQEKRTEKKEKAKSQAEAMKPFFERNKALIASTMEDLKPEYEKWVADQKSILEKYDIPVPEKMERSRRTRVGLFGLTPAGPSPRQRPMMHQREGDKTMRKEKSQGQKKEGKKSGEKGEKKNFRKGSQGKSRVGMEFILWDGSVPPAPEAQTVLPKTNKRIPANDLRIFPNPGTDLMKVRFNLVDAMANATSIITDEQGQVVQENKWSNLPQGFNELELDVSGFTPGIYFYTLKGEGFNVTKQLVKK